jgi:hypothetical protein
MAPVPSPPNPFRPPFCLRGALAANTSEKRPTGQARDQSPHTAMNTFRHCKGCREGKAKGKNAWRHRPHAVTSVRNTMRSVEHPTPRELDAAPLLATTRLRFPTRTQASRTALEGSRLSCGRARQQRRLGVPNTSPRAQSGQAAVMPATRCSELKARAPDNPS